MEHVKTNAPGGGSNNVLPGIRMSENLQKIKLLLLVIGCAFSHQLLQAQCNTLTCNGTTAENPLEVSVNDFCEVSLIPDVILEAEQTCPGSKQLTVRDMSGNILADELDFVSLDVSAHISEVLSITVTDDNSGIFCVGFIRISDFLPPVFDDSGPGFSITCTADTSVAELGLPGVSDNCDSDPTLTYIDALVPNGCGDANAGTLTRTWTATDNSGNTSNYTQTFLFERPSLLEIEFPDDISLSCDAPDTDPIFTGRPVFADSLVENSGLCNLTITYRDDTTPLCGSTEFQVVRQWTVTENCTGLTTTDIQLILILDSTGPEIICQDTIYARTEAGQCLATVNLPEPQMTDNCDGNPSLVVNTSYGAVGLGPHRFVPVGVHSIQYIAIDECGNTNMCTAVLVVVDEEEPTAVCNQAAVSISSAGLALVDAEVFDEGSTDNCVDQLYYKAVRNTVSGCYSNDDSPQDGVQQWYDDKVAFCCEEVGQRVLIHLRVYSVDPGPGAVNPARESPGGDLYGHFSECSVEIEVQDRIGPAIRCLEDITVDCTVDISDLSAFGDPVVEDNCESSITVRTNFNLDDCGLGTITRTFTATDASGNNNTCSQVITIVNETPYVAADISWPEDYTTYNCGESVDPDDLPAGFNRPEVLTQKCGRLTVHYEDELFDISYPACYKILRHWSILDWCTHEPDNPEAGGRFDYVQVIKILDNEEPIMDCPENIIIGIDATCDSAEVSIPLVTATDCNPDVLIVNDSPFAKSGGADASGVYPLGQTTVTYTASDRCGNTATCSININVIDNTPPVPVCIVGLSANLATSNGEGMAVVKARFFDGSSTDNCTAREDLQYTIRRKTPGEVFDTPAEDEEIIFTCEDAGRSHLIEFWVTDQAGNSAFCETFILIQDLGRICPNQVSTGMIAGGIKTESGETVEGVTIKVDNGDAYEILTNLYGHFEMGDMPHGLNYNIIPIKNDDPLNGVSTLDLVLITKHILGVKEFDSPYKLIAGDIDRSGNIATLDLIRLRKLILSITSELPGGNKSWRFIDAGHVFSDPANPWQDDFPERLNINRFDGNAMEINFIGVKVGDVNYSAAPNSVKAGLSGRSQARNWRLGIEKQRVQAGQTFTVEVTANDLLESFGYQFGMRFDPNMMELIKLTPGELPGMGEDNFGLNHAENGLIATSWHHPYPVMIPEREVLFSLEFLAYEDFDLEDYLSLSSRILTAEAYDSNFKFLGIELEFVEAEIVPEHDLDGIIDVYQNRPNPFRDQTVIPFDLARSGLVNFNVFDGTGRRLIQKKEYYNSGRNRITINGNELNTSGVLFYQLETHGKVVTKKMVIRE